MKAASHPDAPAVDLAELHRLILEAETCIGTTIGSAGARIRLCIRIGQMLRAAKTAAGHGHWSQWIADNAPTVEERTARNWMKLSECAEKDGALQDARSIRHAYILAGIVPETGGDGGARAQHDPTNYLVHLDRLKAALELWDISAMDEGERRTMVERLTPIVKLCEILTGVDISP